MGRIFLAAGHGDGETDRITSGDAAGLTPVAREVIFLRDLVTTELRSRGVEAVLIPDQLPRQDGITWVNQRYRPGDMALALSSRFHPLASVRGTAVYYIGHNRDRKQQAELFLLTLARRLPQISIRGAFPDTDTGLGALPFCRQVSVPSLVLQLGFFSNPDDRDLLQNHGQEIALGIADGVVAGGHPGRETGVASDRPGDLEAQATAIHIHLNGKPYAEQGVLVNGNACVPVDFLDRLGVSLDRSPSLRRISRGNVVYVKAVDLRQYDLSVSWDSTNQTVRIGSILPICRTLKEITGRGHASEVQLLMFLKANLAAGLAQFPDIARLYREEGASEGINYDIAFAQMCVETDFLRFGEIIKPGQNNFGGLGIPGGSAAGASFPSARLGVRAHIQHLKAYANTEPLREAVVDPRFGLVARGVAPTVEHLAGRWAADVRYGDRILAVLRRLYEVSGLL